MLENMLTEVVPLDSTRTRHHLRVPQLPRGLSEFDDFFVWKDASSVKVYDRICDHNGGKLLSREGALICPLHGWTLDPATGEYQNVRCSKEPQYVLATAAINDVLTFDTHDIRRTLKNFSLQAPVQVDFLNHACLLFSYETLSFATDPWILGPAFSNGWWHTERSPKESIDLLNDCDFIYISHNHSDHLHPVSLDRIRDDMPILTPNFKSGSTTRFLKSLGFNKVITCDFGRRLIDHDMQVSLSILKSGDFRDDSGLLIELGAFSALLNVDSNYIDFWRFPESLTLVASTFSGGATGYPLCFDNFSEEEKQNIVRRNRSSARKTTISLLTESAPKYFLPYASFFTESANRDSYIYKNNHKIEIDEYNHTCKQLGIQILDIRESRRFIFSGSELISASMHYADFLEDLSEDRYIEDTKKQYQTISRHQIECYFKNSGYEQDLDLEITLCDDNFDTIHQYFSVSFRNKALISIRWSTDEAVQLEQAQTTATKEVNSLHIKIRKDSFIRTLREGSPWEDLSIGFQCRIQREPNVYNSDFWFHFTNVYVREAVFEVFDSCQICTTWLSNDL